MRKVRRKKERALDYEYYFNGGISFSGRMPSKSIID
jgi:hypothetical protein